MINVRASDTRPTTTGVANGVDVDVRVTLPNGEVVDGEVTLLPTFQGRPRYVSWGQPDHWVSGNLLRAMSSLSSGAYTDALNLIEEAASQEAGSPNA